MKEYKTLVYVNHFDQLDAALNLMAQAGWVPFTYHRPTVRSGRDFDAVTFERTIEIPKVPDE